MNIESEEPAKKRLCVEIRDNCLIHCTETSGDLSSLQDTQSWTTLLRAAEIRQYTPILDIAKTVTGEEPPEIKYHHKCRSIFTMKQDLDKICKDANKFNESVVTERRLSMREPPTKNTIYERVCIFCDKVSKYAKGEHVRKKLVQRMDLSADESIRKIATAKNDSKILAIASRNLVAAEGCYHRSCYKAYTWHKKSSTSTTSVTSEDEESYATLVSRLQLAKDLAECLHQQQRECKASSTEEIRRVALEL